MRRIGCMLLALVLFGACSSGSDDPTISAPDSNATADAEETPDRMRERPSPSEPEPTPDEAASGQQDPEPDGDVVPGADPGGDDGVFNDGESEDDHSSALHPKAGRYAYRQSGYERFCQAAACEQQPLPPQQPIHVRITERGPKHAVVVSEIRSSDNRMVRSTTRFSRRNALVTDVYARFTYEGFSFENSYTPRPPVESLRFPLERGSAWSGTWEDSTSGDYSAHVIGRERLRAGGAAVQTYKLSMVTEFRGEFTGSSKALVWVAAATKTIVRTSGKIDLRSSFGRYVTEFNSHLRSGPGYR